jgi:hypothetical protein
MSTTYQSGPAAGFSACEHCNAPMEDSQRYCVTCGARRAQADDPAIRYLAGASRAARAPLVPPAASSSLTPTVAVLLALLPLAAGIGVLVGRGQGSGDEAIIAALKAQKPPVVNVTGASGGTAATASPAGAAAARTANGKTKAKASTKDGAKILAHGPAGDARQLEGQKVTKQQLQDSAAAVKKINSAKGKTYVDSQRDLPDQIVIP